MVDGGSIFLRSAGKSIPGLLSVFEDRLFHARAVTLQRDDKVRVMNHTQTRELQKHEDQHDFFCVISDAFRVFARKSSVMLGSAWAFAAAVSIILVWVLTGPTF